MKFTDAEEDELAVALQCYARTLVRKGRWTPSEAEVLRAALDEHARGYERLAANPNNKQLRREDAKTAAEIRRLEKKVKRST